MARGGFTSAGLTILSSSRSRSAPVPGRPGVREACARSGRSPPAWSTLAGGEASAIPDAEAAVGPMTGAIGLIKPTSTGIRCNGARIVAPTTSRRSRSKSSAALSRRRRSSAPLRPDCAASVAERSFGFDTLLAPKYSASR
jgi:hypothetical protein